MPPYPVQVRKERRAAATLTGGGPTLRVTGTIHDDDGPPTAAFEVMGAACRDD